MIRTVSRFLVVGAVAALAALPLPAQAQGTLKFGIIFGDEQADFYPRRAICLTNHQMRESMAARGYTDIALNVPNDGRIEIRASWDGWVYLIDFDYCRDRIVGVRQLRPAG